MKNMIFFYQRYDHLFFQVMHIIKLKLNQNTHHDITCKFFFHWKRKNKEWLIMICNILKVIRSFKKQSENNWLLLETEFQETAPITHFKF